MEYTVSDGRSYIDFGAAGATEVLQNVRMILTTLAWSCPLDREFAWEPVELDGPINLVRAKSTARIIAAIKKYEPRAQVISVAYQGGGLNGVLKPVVKVRVEE